MDEKKKESPVSFPPDAQKAQPVKEPGPKPDPTRFGDWEMNGRCIDF